MLALAFTEVALFHTLAIVTAAIRIPIYVTICTIPIMVTKDVLISNVPMSTRRRMTISMPFMLGTLPAVGTIIRIYTAAESSHPSPLTLLAINLETSLNILFACVPALFLTVKSSFKRLARAAANRHTSSESSHDSAKSNPDQAIVGENNESKIRGDNKVAGFHSRNTGGIGTSNDNLIKGEGIAV